MQFYWIFSLIFALIIALFAIQNAESVSIRFFIWQFQNISLVLVILGSAAAGALVLFILNTMKHMKMAWRIRDAEGKARKLEIELAQIKEEKDRDFHRIKLLEEKVARFKDLTNGNEVKEGKLTPKELSEGN